MALKHVNAVVVGSGAGGGVAAKELAEAGLSVVVLERGGWAQHREHFDDEFLFMNGEFLSPDARHVRVVSQGGRWVTVPPANPGYCNNAMAVGGGTVFYGAMAWRFNPIDFRMRSTYGEVKDSSLADWPISYGDLEPFYEKVEWEVGVSGDMSGCPQAPPRKKDYPMPAFPYNVAAELLAAGGKRAGLHPFPVSMLRNSVPYNNRPACIQRRFCPGYNCPVDGKNGTHNTVLPMALAAGNCTIRTGCMAANIVLSDQGQARGVRYFDSDNREQFQPSDIVVLSAGATETARLLLNSKSQMFPNGAGNNQGWVGHNLQGHKYANVNGVFEKEVYGGPGPVACMGFLDFAHHNPGMVGGGLLDCPRALPPLRYALSLPGWGAAYKNRLREFKRRTSISVCLMDVPVFESHVEIDPQVKDFWGIPVLRIMAQRHPNDFVVQNFMSQKAAGVLRASGAIRVQAPEVEVPSAPVVTRPHGQHQAGTCRMGDDPKTSVTNRYGQLHEIDNVFCADASLHVTNACLNPAETIMALGYWVSHHIKQQWKGTKFRAG